MLLQTVITIHVLCGNLLGLYVHRDVDHDHAGPATHGGRIGSCHGHGDLLGVYHPIYPLGKAAVQRRLIHILADIQLLLGAVTGLIGGDITADHDNGTVGQGLFHYAGDGLHHAGAVGHQQYAGPAGGLKISACRRSTDRFIVNDDPLDAVSILCLVKAVADGEVAVAAHAEDVLYTQFGKALH